MPEKASLISGPDGDKGSGRNILDTREAEQVVEALDHRIDPLFRQRAHHTGEGLKGVCAAAVFRALRHLAGDHRRAQRALRAIVRRLDPRIFQEPYQVAPVVVPAQFIEPPDRKSTRLNSSHVRISYAVFCLKKKKKKK